MSTDPPDNQTVTVSPVATDAFNEGTQTTADPSDAVTDNTEEETTMKSSPEAKSSGGSNRIYIRNVSYQTTESDLYDFVRDFDVVSVLIPSHTVRGFKSLKQKSLGIAYVDFSSPEEAERAKTVLNGKQLNKRVLKVKSFTPYIPNRVIAKADHKETDGPTCTATDHFDSSPVADSDAVQDSKDVAETSGAESSMKSESDEQTTTSSKSSVFSTDTVFIDRLSPKTNDSALRAYFANYTPTEVYIFKCRYLQNEKSKSFFRHRQYVSALVTLGAEDGLSKALKELKGTKLRGRHVSLKASYLSKIEEVKKAAQAQHIPVQKVDVKDLSSCNVVPSTVAVSSTEGLLASKIPCACVNAYEDNDCAGACSSEAMSPGAHGCGCASVDDEMAVTGTPIDPVN